MNISNALPLWVSEIDLNNVLSDLGGLARPRETALSARAEAAEAMPMGRELQPLPGRRASPRAQRHSSINSGSDYARVPWLPVTFLVRADEPCIGQHVALHCSLDLRFRRAS